MNKKTIIWIIIILLLAVGSMMAVRTINGNDMEDEQHSFRATVLENKGTSILVEPVKGEAELSSSDKIVVRVPKDSAVLEDLSKFTVGSKVKITYSGAVMESYPAQINATKVELTE